MSDYLPNLKKSIKTNKIGQAKTLLSQIRDRHSAEKQEIIQMVALAPDKIAYELLTFLTDSQHRDPEIYDRLIQLVTDRAHLNFTFALILLEKADRPTIIHTIPLLRHILTNETDKQVLANIIRTTGKIKLEHLVEDIAEFIFYDDFTLKNDAVKALERIGTESALKTLEKAAKTEKCDDNILDAIEALKAAAPSGEKPVPESRPAPAPDIPVKEEAASVQGLCDPLLKKRFETYFKLPGKNLPYSELLSDKNILENQDLLLNLLRIISRTIPLDAVSHLFSLLSNKKTNNHIKFSVYNALEAFPELESAASVVQGISESVFFLRLAAVKVLNKNLSDFVCAEIKNKIESGTKKGEILAQTILDARARNIIEYLMISDTFSYIASNYLSRNAPIPVLDTFIEILQYRNLKSTAKKYLDIRDQRLKEKQNDVILISSSEAVLDVYSKMIFSCGYFCKAFMQPQDAFEAFVFEKPKAIISDLFLNDITGLDIAKEARDMYSKNEVPFIISTMQKSLDELDFEKELDASGVNFLCEFPAKTSQIKSWLK